MCLATEKFVYEAANDAMQYCKIRMQGMSAKDRKVCTYIQLCETIAAILCS